MEEESSWIRRTKYSHTIYHRLDSGRLSVDSKLTSIPLTSQSDRIAGLKSRPAKGSSVTEIQLNPKTNKPRAVSPHPETKLSDTFEEARSDRRRFSTPHPVRKGSGKNLHKDPVEKKASHTKHHSKSLKISSMKFYDKSKSTKESAWAKFFDHGQGKVTSVESADEWMLDLSKLFIGLRFAHGAHSQLYHGSYKDEPVAVKMIRVPDDIYDGSLGASLEKQFTREVTLLSRLHHQNVIKVMAYFCSP